MGEPRPSFFNLSVVVIDLIDIDGAIEHDLRALKIKFYKQARGNSFVTGEKFSSDSFLASFGQIFWQLFLNLLLCSKCLFLYCLWFPVERDCAVCIAVVFRELLAQLRASIRFGLLGSGNHSGVEVDLSCSKLVSARALSVA